jgi:hypothetical protein
MLMIKLEIQSEFTQIAYVGGVNGVLSCGPGLMSWIVTEINAARAAENRPVYRSFFQLTCFWVCKQERGLTKSTIPSASFSCRSALFLSSSSTIFE